MATTKNFHDYFIEATRGVGGITTRAMMGEYVLYYNGKVVGGIYDNRVLVKDIPAARALLPDARLELPYEGSKLALYLEDFENEEAVRRLFEAMYDALPAPKPRKSK